MGLNNEEISQCLIQALNVVLCLAEKLFFQLVVKIFLRGKLVGVAAHRFRRPCSRLGLRF